MNFVLSSSRRDGPRRAVVCAIAICAGLLAGCTERAESPLAAPGGAQLALTPNNMIIVNGNNQVGVAGDTLVKPITVEVRANGYPVPNITVYWSVVSGGGSLRHPSSVGNSVGRASNRWVLGPSGTQKVKAEVPGAGFVIFDARVLPAGSTLRIVSGNGQKGLMNTSPLLYPLVVELVDGSGNPLPDIPLTWTKSSTQGYLRYPTTTTTGSDGRAANEWGLGGTTEPKTLLVQVGQLSATFTAIPLRRVLFTRISGNDQVGTSADSLAAPLVVEVRDTTGAPLPGIRVFWTRQSTHLNRTVGGLRASYSGTDSQGRAVNRWILGAAPDTQVVLAGVGGGPAPNGGAPSLTFTARLGTLPPAATITELRLSRARVYSRHVGTERDITATVLARSVKGITHVTVRFLNPMGAELPGGVCSRDLSATLPTIVTELCTERIPFGAAHGIYTVEAQVTDAAGNTDTETATFRVDATNPLTSSASGISPATINSSSADPAARQVTGSMTAASSQGVTQLNVTLLMAGNPQCNKALSGATTATDSCALTVPQGLAPGTYTVRVRMTDAAGNVIGANRVLTVTH